jgi:hypothetical protein
MACITVFSNGLTASPGRHVYADSRARRRHVGLAQHLPGGYRTATDPDPASQRDGPAHDNAFTRKPRRVAKLIPGNRHVHVGTLLRLQPQAPAPRFGYHGE